MLFNSYQELLVVYVCCNIKRYVNNSFYCNVDCSVNKKNITCRYIFNLY